MKTLPFLLLFILIGCSKEPDFTKNNGTFKDSRDKHEYKWVRVGEQIWMAENLAYLPSVSPSSDGSEASPFYYIYDYESSSVSQAKTKPNYTTYGVLYNWEAARIACPSGWHLPTFAEWIILKDYLGPLPGKKMKSITYWANNGNGDNSSGFNALPGGYRADFGGFGGIAHEAFFWSATEVNEVIFSIAWGTRLGAGDSALDPLDAIISMGISVRCIKDN